MKALILIIAILAVLSLGLNVWQGIKLLRAGTGNNNSQNNGSGSSGSTGSGANVPAAQLIMSHNALAGGIVN